MHASESRGGRGAARASGVLPARPAGGVAAGGFTLVEVLIALAIVVALASLSLPVAFGLLDAARFRGSAEHVAALIEGTRQRAIDTGKPLRLVAVPRVDERAVREGGAWITEAEAPVVYALYRVGLDTPLPEADGAGGSPWWAGEQDEAGADAEADGAFGGATAQAEFERGWRFGAEPAGGGSRRSATGAVPGGGVSGGGPDDDPDEGEGGGVEPGPVVLAAFLPSGQSIGPRELEMTSGGARAVIAVSRWSGRTSVSVGRVEAKAGLAEEDAASAAADGARADADAGDRADDRRDEERDAWPDERADDEPDAGGRP